MKRTWAGLTQAGCETAAGCAGWSGDKVVHLFISLSLMLQQNKLGCLQVGMLFQSVLISACEPEPARVEKHSSV